MAAKKPKDRKPSDAKPKAGGGKSEGSALVRWSVRLIVLLAVYVASFFLAAWVSHLGWLDGVPYAKPTLQIVYMPLDHAYHAWMRPSLDAGTRCFGGR
jgi:hypothetical protein